LYNRVVSDREAISVIIPFYNRANYLPDAVRSVFFQTRGDIQLILVDDGSTDGSSEAAVAAWNRALEDRRTDGGPAGLREMRILNLPHSGMPGLARNRGVDAADGRLIAFLDSDDIWLPRKLELQLPLHAPRRGDNSVGAPGDGEIPLLSHTRERWLRAEDGKGAPLPPMKEISQSGQRHARSGDLFADSLWKCIIGPSTVLMDRELYLDLGGFREDLQVAEDYEFWIRVTAGHHAGYIDEPCIEKRAGLPGQEQLSERFGQIEGFRLRALWGLLGERRFDGFSPDQQALAWQVLQRKAEIFLTGARKHANASGERFARMILDACDRLAEGDRG
jgi:glycosyltransferase involved in cell wall biosynthesis